MGSWWSGEEKQARQAADLRHREELERMAQEMDRKVAMERKIGRKRTKVLKKKPGMSNDFPKVMNVPNRLFISLFGETGIGKSSLINSIKYTIEVGLNNKQRIQSADPNYQGAHTMESRDYVLTEHLSVIDNPGIKCEEAADANKQNDVIKRMGGRYETGTITWQSLAPGHEHEEDKKSYCSVMVFSAHNANVARGYRSFIHRLRDWQGCFPLAVITHVDQVPSDDVRLALQSGGIGQIYEVANITSGEKCRDELSPNHQLQLLQLLEQCFNDGDSIFLRRQEIGN